MLAKSAVGPRMGLAARETGEIGIFVMPAIFLGLKIVRRVRRVERNQEVERVLLPALLIEKLQREVAHAICFEAFGLNTLAVLHEFNVFERPAAAWHGRPVSEAALRLIVVPHVPLTAHTERI